MAAMGAVAGFGASMGDGIWGMGAPMSSNTAEVADEDNA
jgi:hypothetical protein